MQVDENVDGQRIEFDLVGARVEQPGEGVVAEILEQQQSAIGVLGEDAGRAQAEVRQVAGDGEERANVFVFRRRIHQHGPPPAGREPVVAAKGRIVR